ncbi:MAG: polysaccharide biosynthesis protein [Prevotella sp.]|nr:polysaccharide biosynthesis protein [Prevotella sp.]
MGIDDYGIYNLVGGVVAMFVSLKNVFASSVQRFLNYEKGKGNDERVKKVFNLSMLIHVLLAISFAVIVEGFGLWFISHRLTIPAGSLSDALFVFHCSVFNAVILIMTSPYNAVIIANERINVFAWISVADALLKLLIIYIVPVLMFHYLRSYASLMMLIGIANIIFCISYCRKFTECTYALFWDKSLFVQLLSFAGWNFLGSTVFSLVSEGVNIILNIFGGVAINAARGISNQVKNSINTFSNNLFVAIQPFVIQQAASQDKDVIFRYTFRISRFMFLIVLMTVLPVIIYCDSILKVWLVHPPYMACIFLQLMLVNLAQRSLHSPLDLLFKSFGNIKLYQIIDSATLFLSLPISYVAMRLGLPLYAVFAVMCIVEVINLICVLSCAHIQLGLSLSEWLKRVGIYCLGVTVVLVALNLMMELFIHPHKFFEVAFTIILLFVLEALFAYSLLLNKQDKHFVQGYIGNKIKKRSQENMIAD